MTDWTIVFCCLFVYSFDIVVCFVVVCFVSLFSGGGWGGWGLGE